MLCKLDLYLAPCSVTLPGTLELIGADFVLEVFAVDVPQVDAFRNIVALVLVFVAVGVYVGRITPEVMVFEDLNFAFVRVERNRLNTERECIVEPVVCEWVVSFPDSSHIESSLDHLISCSGSRAVLLRVESQSVMARIYISDFDDSDSVGVVDQVVIGVVHAAADHFVLTVDQSDRSALTAPPGLGFNALQIRQAAIDVFACFSCEIDLVFFVIKVAAVILGRLS